MTDSLHKLGAADILQRIHTGSLSSVEYAQEVIKSSKEHQTLNSVACMNEELFLEKARHADAKRSEGLAGELCGLPLVIKDNINTVELPTTAGTPALHNNIPAENAGVITALEKQDAIIAAKSNLHELAFGITSNNAATGAVRNPHHSAKIPGGSSGGTAAAIAANVFPAGLGSDTGGSVRIPAALCGIVGFRPTTGRYAPDGMVPISHTRDTAGAMARHVEDIILLDGVLAGQNIIREKKDLSQVVLGISKDVHFDHLEAEVEKAIQDQLRILEAAGAKLVEVDISDIWEHNAAFSFPVVLYEFMREMPDYLKKHAPAVSFESLCEQIRSQDVQGIVQSQLGDGAIPEEAYRMALDVHRPAMRNIWASAFKNHELTAMVFPTTPLRASNIGEDETVPLNGDQVPTFPTYIRNTDLGSNLGVPGISLPCQNVNGLPIGIEFDGTLGGDQDIMELASSVEMILSR